MVKRGYMTLTEHPLKPFKCKYESLCPGGELGSCAPGRDPTAVGCGDCQTNKYNTAEDGGCKDCEGWEGPVLVVAGIVGAVVFLGVLTFLVRFDGATKTNSTAAVGIMAGLFLTCIQTFGGVFSNLRVIWPEPMKTMLTYMKVLAFDLNAIRSQCIIGPTPWRTYVMRQAVVPVVTPVVYALCFVKSKVKSEQVSVPLEFCNCAGVLYGAFYISILISAWLPFFCQDQPNGNSTTLVSYTSVLCFDSDEHSLMVIVGIVSTCLVSVPFLCVVAWATYRYPRYVAMGRDNNDYYLRMFRFLFWRFKPEAYFYGLLLLLRSASLCFVPAFGAFFDMSVEVVLMTNIILLFALIQLLLQPWRSSAANLADGVLSIFTISLLMCATMSTDFGDVSSTIKGLTGFGTVCIVLALLGFPGYALYMKLSEKVRFYAFICHHKLAAAAQARLVQMQLQEDTKQEVFVDSDHLKNLDALFDVVKTSIQQLVAYLTSATLRRPWCAGEVATAFTNKIKMVAVRHPSFKDDFLPQPSDGMSPEMSLGSNDITSYIDEADFNLIDYSIRNRAILEAFIFLTKSCETVEWPASHGRHTFVVISMSIMGKAADELKEVQLVGDRRLLLSTDLSDDEATAAAAIVVFKIQEEVLSSQISGMTCICDVQGVTSEDVFNASVRSKGVAIMLSKDSLCCIQQIAAILGSVSQDIVTPVLLPYFEFPNPEFWQKVFRLRWESGHKLVEEATNKMFKKIAVSLPTHSSSAILDAQCCEIFQRCSSTFTGSTDATQNLPTWIEMLGTSSSLEIGIPQEPPAGTSSGVGAVPPEQKAVEVEV